VLTMAVHDALLAVGAQPYLALRKWDVDLRGEQRIVHGHGEVTLRPHPRIELIGPHLHLELERAFAEGAQEHGGRWLEEHLLVRASPGEQDLRNLLRRRAVGHPDR